MNAFKDLDPIAIVQVLLIAIAGWLMIMVSQRVLPWLADRFAGQRRLYILGAVPVLRLFIIATAAGLIVTRVIDPTFENLIALLGALGLALGFALKDYASSLIAGIVTLYEIPYRLGDWISVEGAYGEVKSIGLRTAEIITPDDTVVVVPHLKLWDSLIFNANDGTNRLQCSADFYLHPRHDPRRVVNVLRDVALSSAYLQIHQPVSVVAQDKPWGTHYRLKAYPVDPRDQFRFLTDLTMRGKTALTELGVDFAVAQITADGTPG